MEQSSKIFLLSCALMILSFGAGCGVKGRPMSPLTPPPLGRGVPTESEVKKKDQIKNRYDIDQENEEVTSE